MIITGVTGFVGTYNDYLNGMWLGRLIFIAGPLSAAKLGRIESMFSLGRTVALPILVLDHSKYL